MNHLDLNGQRIIRCRVTLPAWGAWTASVELASGLPIVGPVLLTLGTMTLVGSVVRQVSFAEATTALLVGGAGGWSKELEPRAYSLPTGVPVALLLGDAAIEVGEVLVGADPSALAGPCWARVRGPASTVLALLVGPSWWVDGAGVTHVEPRPPGAPIASPFLVEHYDGAQGRLVVSTEDLASWLPGAVVTSATIPTPITLSSVSIAAENDGELRVEALAA